MTLPIASDQVPPEWIDDVREIIQREGQPIRAGLKPTIEVKSLRLNLWMPLMLPGSAMEFIDEQNRDSVLDKIICKQ